MNFNTNLLIIVGILHASSGNFSTKSHHREHKIHNIVLYPDKHSWCKTTAIAQVVGHPGCNSVTIDNNVCVGACFSYIVPKTVPDTPGDIIQPYCDSCQPETTSWKKITLECTEGNNKNQNFTKYVEYIHNCSCGTCKDQLMQTSPSEEDLEADEFDSGLISDTFNVTADGSWPLNSTNSSLPDFQGRISGLLKTLTNEDENILENSEVKGLHKNVWKKLLQKMESIDGSIDANVFSQLVKSVEEELKIKFNYKRLKQALFKLKKYQAITKQNSKIDETIIVPQLLQRQGLNRDTTKTEDLTTSTSTVPPKDPKDLFPSSLYSKLPSSGLENETAAPIMIDVAYLKPATGGSEISYHDNPEGPNHKIDKKDKLSIN